MACARIFASADQGASRLCVVYGAVVAFVAACGAHASRIAIYKTAKCTSIYSYLVSIYLYDARSPLRARILSYGVRVMVITVFYVLYVRGVRTHLIHV